MPEPEAFRGFIEGVQKLQDYLHTNAGERLVDAEEQFNESLAADPDFIPAQYYKAIVLTHARKADEAIPLLEGLNRPDSPFRTEVLYNLAFANAKTYRYENVVKGHDLLDEAATLASQRQRPDLELLVQAMQAWIKSVLGGLPLGHEDNFVDRQKKYLPEAVTQAESVLADPRLELLPPETGNAVRVEVHNAAGIAFMYQGQYSVRFEEKVTEQYWGLADDQYEQALSLHPRDVRVLDNMATLNLTRAVRAARQHDDGQKKEFSKRAKELTRTALSYNTHDKFRYLNLARSCALLGQTEEALEAARLIRLEPGVIKEADVRRLEKAILHDDLKPILEKYPIEEKPSSA